MDDILRLQDMRSVQFLLLLSIYSLRSSRSAGAWIYSGLAMRHCIEMGMHRKTRKSMSLLEHEIRKRVFWTCYCLDRQVSIILGRPFAISDRDINVELPLDVDEACEDLAILEKAQYIASQPTGPATKSTSMTGFIYICRLRVIESDIQQSIYRVDQSAPATEAEAEQLIQQLEEWKASMPTDASTMNPDSMVVDGNDNYMVYYYKCLRFLLHPVILSSELANSKLLRKCVESCGGVLRTYKKLHQQTPVGFSVMALHSVFITGLTLIYCVWASPKEVFSISISDDMNACSIVLYIITERWSGARRYRDVYEAIKQMVLESIEEGGYEPRRTITNLRPSLRAALKTMDHHDEGQREFSAMLSDMAGGTPEPELPQLATPSTDDTPRPQGLMLPLSEMQLDSEEADAVNTIDLQLGTIFSTPSSDWMIT
ncbi:fungal-specific transcription factor domain-containing protein [Xylariales sp. AK1849]|nr:fungal-specific transcription factor domain-containing protein [Xylariales sp. AK1849]